MASRPKRKLGVVTTRPTTCSNPRRRRSSPRSPICFMACESKTSPVVEASTMAVMDSQAYRSLTKSSRLSRSTSRQHFRLSRLFAMRVMGERRALGHEPDSGGNQHNAEPARGGHVFVQQEFGDEGQQDITDRGGGQHVSQIGPGKRGHVCSEKTNQQHHPQGYPGMGHREDDLMPVIERDLAHFLHAAGKKGIAGGAENNDSQQDQVLTQVHARS